MSTPVIDTVIKMIETLPEAAQDKVVEHLREYIDDLLDETLWDDAFKRSQPQLGNIAKQVRKEISAGLSLPMDESLL